MSGAHFQFPHPQAGPVRIHAHYGCYSGLIHGLISFCCEIPLPEHPVFLGAGRKTRRNLYMEISPAMGNISPYTCPHKRSTTSVIADSTWNVVTSPHFMTKHSLCHCPRVEQTLTALTYGPLSTAFVTVHLHLFGEKLCCLIPSCLANQFCCMGGISALLLSAYTSGSSDSVFCSGVLTLLTLPVLETFLKSTDAHCKLIYKMLSVSALLSSRDHLNEDKPPFHLKTQ